MWSAGFGGGCWFGGEVVVGEWPVVVGLGVVLVAGGGGPGRVAGFGVAS